MHYWGDEDFDWAGLDEAGEYISQNLRRKARLAAFYKEKYGTARIDYVYFGFSLHGLIWPQYLFKHPKCPRWGWSLDLYLQGKGVYNMLINPWYIKWQKHIYNKTYDEALKKWPHLRDEILAGKDYRE